MRLDLESVSFSRPGRPEVVANFNLSIESGGTAALLGPNGAGKTTVLGLASGRLAPASGTVRLDGRSLAELGKPALARMVAVLPQIEKLGFNYTCLDFVLLGRAPHVPALSMPGKKDYEAAWAALETLGLGDFARRPTGELSGGELQLVRCARCLAQEATVLLLDEPTSMLDPANALRIADTLRSLASLGKAILFATHDAALAAYLADEIVLLRAGQTVGKGSRTEALSAAQLRNTFGVDFGPDPTPGVFGG